jgi:hypothetical protein
MRELAHVLVQRWSELDSVLARAPRLMPGDRTLAVPFPTPTQTPASGVEVLRDAFKAIHGLVAALSERCESLEPIARAEALSRVQAVSQAVDELHRVEQLVSRKDEAQKPPVADDA